MISKRTLTLFQLIWLACTLLTVNVQAADLISSAAYYEDSTRALSYEQIQDEKLKEFEGVLSRGYTNSATWVRLEISPPKDLSSGDQLVLVVKPVFLDEIRLFDPLDKTGKERVGGDKSTFDSAEFKSLNHTFVVPAGNAPRFIWLRVVSTSTTIIDAQVFTFSEMAQQELESQLFTFCALGLMGVLLLHGLINWFNQRETLYAIFVVKQFNLFVYTGASFGLHRYVFQNLLSPTQLDAFYSWTVIGATTITLIFERQFQREYTLKKYGKYVQDFLMLVSLLVFLLMLFDQTLIALQINMALNSLAIVTFFVIAVTCIDSREVANSAATKLLDKKMVIAYYGIINIVILSSVMSFLGVTKAGHYTTNALIYYTLIAGALMTWLMQLRANNIIKAKNEYEKNLLLLQQQTASEIKRREEQAHLLHMLMHELKNPLAIIEMAQHAGDESKITKDYISRSVTNMKEIIDRCVKVERLEDGRVDVHHEIVSLDRFVPEFLTSRREDELEIEVLLGENLTVKSDAQLLRVMLNNLIDNAVRYGDQLIPIELSAYRCMNAEGISGVSITISNRPGAASWPDVNQIFVKYYRSEGAKSQSGTGLGLYLVRTLARLLGGDCRYLPDDKYIKFELWLPS